MFADDVENAALRTEEETERAIKATLAKATPIDPGVIGDCHTCGIYRPRLVSRVHRGRNVMACTFCRDKLGLDK